MRHKKAYRKLGRTPSHRRALLRNLATALVVHNRIETTLPKAKALQRVADKLVTLGKTDTLHRRRQAMKYLFAVNRTKDRTKKTGDLQKLTPVHRLFAEIAPRYTERNGGYTRVVRTRRRVGDNAQLAVIEFVEAELTSKEKPTRRKRRVRKNADEVPAKSGVVESAATEKSSQEESAKEESAA